MIRTPRKKKAPEELRKNKVKWTKRWLDIRKKKLKLDWVTKKAKRVLRETLEHMTHGKCAYCEGKLGVTAHFEIEHYESKTVAPKKAFNWTNLFLACGICNGVKGNQDHKGMLIRSDRENPEEFFWVHPDTGELQPHPSLDEKGQERALETIRLCDLQRGPLCTMRADLVRGYTDLAEEDRRQFEVR